MEKTLTVTIRRLSAYEEFLEVARLSKEIWGFSDLEAVSPLTLLAMGKDLPPMGLFYGAFLEDDDRSRMIGFNLVFPTRQSRVMSGHLMGVLEDFRDRKVGAMLFEREMADLRELGMDTVYWSYEPLDGRNSNLYINKLGAVVTGYEADLRRTELPADLFIVRWEFTSPRAREKRGGRHVDEHLDSLLEKYPVADEDRMPDGDRVLVEIPEDFERLRRELPEEALRCRMTTRAIFQEYLTRRGFVIRTLASSVEGQRRRNFYVLSAPLSLSLS